MGEKSDFGGVFRRIGVGAPGSLPEMFGSDDLEEESQNLPRVHSDPEVDPEGFERDIVSALGKTIDRQRKIISAVRVHASVQDVIDASPADGQLTFEVGTRVLIKKSSKYPDMVDKGGVVLDPPTDEEDNILVALDDGHLGYFHFDGENPEIVDLHPDERRRVVVSLESKTLELQYPPGLEIKPGDTVALHHRTLQIVGVVKKDGEANVFQVTKATGVDWSDVGGQDEAVQALIDAIEMPHMHPELYAHHGLSAPRGKLLLGPPGCGKTLLMRAAATAVARTHGHDRPIGFLLVKAPEILHHLVSMAERRVRGIFNWARKFHEKHGWWPLIGIDEVDAIGKKRGTGISSDATDSIVNAFLTEMDAFDGNEGPMLIAATNRPDILDDALMRDGRFDSKITIKRPDTQAAAMIFRIYLNKHPLDEGVEREEAVRAAVQALFSTQRAFYNITVLRPAKEEGGEPTPEDMAFTLGHISSGAMIAGLVQAASLLAFKRDVSAGTKTGIRIEELVAAIQAKYEENAPYDHRDALKELRMTITDPVKDIKRLTQAR